MERVTQVEKSGGDGQTVDTKPTTRHQRYDREHRRPPITAANTRAAVSVEWSAAASAAVSAAVDVEAAMAAVGTLVAGLEGLRHRRHPRHPTDGEQRQAGGCQRQPRACPLCQGLPSTSRGVSGRGSRACSDAETWRTT